MPKFIRVFLIFILIAASYSACQRASEENTTEEGLIVLEADSVEGIFAAKRESLNGAWFAYANEEEEKLSDLKRLLQEISYTKSYNRLRYDSLWRKLQYAESSMLQQADMSTQEIDRYDTEVASLKSQIIDFAMAHPEFEGYPLMPKLIDSVQARDERILFHRVRYDNYARDYNNFLKPARQYPLKIDTTELRSFPLFQLEE